MRLLCIILVPSFLMIGCMGTPLTNYAQHEAIDVSKQSDHELSKATKSDYPGTGSTVYTFGQGATVAGNPDAASKLADALVAIVTQKSQSEVKIEASRKEAIQIQAESDSSQKLNALGYAVAAVIFMAVLWALVSFLKSSAAGRAALATADAVGVATFGAAKDAVHRLEDSLAKTNDDKEAISILVEQKRHLSDALNKIQSSP